MGVITVKWYTLLFGLTFASGYQIMHWIYRHEGHPMEEVDNLLIYTVLGTFAGARLGHCLFYDPLYYLGNPVEILKIWNGGLSSHGAAIGIIAALYLLTRRNTRQTFLWLSDRIVIPLALAGCFVRLGNLFNSEILGTPTKLPWAFVFERFDNIPRHPVQIYESITYGGIFILLFVLYRKDNRKFQPGFLSGVFLVSFFIARFTFEFFKTQQASYRADLLISVGQWFSIPFIIVGAILLFRSQTVKSPSHI